SSLEDWLKRESAVLAAYVAGISARLFTQRATAILSADILSLPVPEDRKLDLSRNERIIAQDIVDYQRDFIRLGTKSRAMRAVQPESLEAFDALLVEQINAVYPRQRLRPLGSQRWSGAICRAYAFGDGEVDWSGAGALRGKLDALLRERHGS